MKLFICLTILLVSSSLAEDETQKKTRKRGVLGEAVAPEGHFVVNNGELPQALHGVQILDGQSLGGLRGGFIINHGGQAYGLAGPHLARIPVGHQQPLLVVKKVQEQVHVPHPVPVPVTKNVAVPIPQPIAVPVDRPVPVHIPKPYAVEVERPVAVPVEKPFAVPVHIPIRVPVPQPYGIPIEKHIAVPVPKPYAVPVPQPFIIEKHIPIIVDSGSNLGAIPVGPPIIGLGRGHGGQHGNLVQAVILNGPHGAQGGHLIPLGAHQGGVYAPTYAVKAW